VRVVSVGAASFAQHTGTMATDTRATTFAGAAGPAGAPGIGESFDEVVLPHLDAAYRLARWLMRNDHDAEDVVQEASLRAFRYFRTFTGGNGRAWFLRIVRNTASGWRGHRLQTSTEPFDEERHSSVRQADDPEALVLHTDDVVLIERAMKRLPDRFRELLVLRELEGLSYRELAQVFGIPVGTVMSGLSRARQEFRGALDAQLKQHGIPERTHPRKQKAGAAPLRAALRPMAALQERRVCEACER
jgi:RNA polymerase sigma-70 factor (ECF subfamily)